VWQIATDVDYACSAGNSQGIWMLERSNNLEKPFGAHETAEEVSRLGWFDFVWDAS
jgi:hypothetical protein